MKSSLSQADESTIHSLKNDENLTLLQRQESNLLPLDYETNMQPLTPRCGQKTSISSRTWRRKIIINQITHLFKNHVVADERVELPIARSELAVFPLHQSAFTKTAYLHRRADWFSYFKIIINYEKYLLPYKSRGSRDRIQTYNSCATQGFIN